LIKVFPENTTERSSQWWFLHKVRNKWFLWRGEKEKQKRVEKEENEQVRKNFYKMYVVPRYR
jgi:hypothetical protein